MQNNLELAQKQSLSQTQIQSLEIMNLCNQDLYTFLNEEYMENPLMDKTGESAPGEVQEFDEWYLHGQTFNEGYGSEDKEAKDLIETLHANGSKTVVITSMKIEGQSCTLVLDGESGEITSLPYTEIPVRFAGTGDIFSSVLIGKYKSGTSLIASVQHAMDTVEKLIAKNKDNEDKYKGIPIEQYLEEIV